MGCGASAQDVLERSRALVAPALKAVVSRLLPEMALAAGFHFGWAEADGSPVSPDGGAGGGKYVRSALALLSAEAAGASPEVGVPGAVGVELIHNFSLIHDDIIDNDDLRRHRPTVWRTYGVGEAIIIGDALHTLAFEQLLETGGAARLAAVADLAEATTAMIAGQHQDMSFDKLTSVSLDDCLQMLTRKTAALLAHACAVGAILAEAPPTVVVALREFGLQIGVGFQAVDDLLGIWGDPAATGKPVGNDLRERKKTLPVALALEAGGREAEALSDILAQEHLSDSDVALAAELVVSAGGGEAASEVARSALSGARDALASVDVASRPAAELNTLAAFIVEREF